MAGTVTGPSQNQAPYRLRYLELDSPACPLRDRGHDRTSIHRSTYLSHTLPRRVKKLAKTAQGIDMVKRLRQNLIALGRDKLREQESKITGAKTLALFTDIAVQIGERVFVFTVDRDIQGESR